MLPLRYSGQHRAPWPPTACARLLHPSLFPVTGGALCSVGPGWSFRSFRCFPSSRFNLTDPSVVDVGLTTLLSIARAGVARPRPRSARYPFPSGRESTPWPPSILRQVPTVEPKPDSLSSFRSGLPLIAGDLPRGVTRFPSSGSHLTVVRAT
jgi:hypothetical protein